MTAIDPRTIPVRFSALKNMALSPAHYLDSLLHDGDDSLARRIGRGVHALLFGLPVAVYEGKVRRGKEWEAFKANAAGEILNVTEHDQSRRVVDAIRNNADASALMFGADIKNEHKFMWRTLGRQCRGTPDAYGPRHLVDLKTHRRQKPEKFVSSAAWMGYHGQLAWYQNGLRAEGLSTADDVYIVAVESVRPFPVTVYRLTDEALDLGNRMWRGWLEQLLGCEQSEQWPAYAQSVIPFHVEQDTELVFANDGDNPPDPEWIAGDESEAA